MQLVTAVRADVQGHLFSFVNLKHSWAGDYLSALHDPFEDLAARWTALRLRRRAGRHAHRRRCVDSGRGRAHRRLQLGTLRPKEEPQRGNHQYCSDNESDWLDDHRCEWITIVREKSNRAPLFL